MIEPTPAQIKVAARAAYTAKLGRSLNDYRTYEQMAEAALRAALNLKERM